MKRGQIPPAIWRGFYIVLGSKFLPSTALPITRCLWVAPCPHCWSKYSVQHLNVDHIPGLQCCPWASGSKHDLSFNCVTSNLIRPTLWPRYPLSYLPGFQVIKITYTWTYPGHNIFLSLRPLITLVLLLAISLHGFIDMGKNENAVPLLSLKTLVIGDLKDKWLYCNYFADFRVSLNNIHEGGPQRYSDKNFFF